MGMRDEFVKAIKLAFVTVNTRAFMGVLVSKIPFIAAYPWLYKLIEHQVKDIMTKSADEVEVATFFKYIDVRTSSQGVEFMEAAVDNWLAQNNPDIPKEERARREEILFSKFKAFAKFTA